MEKKVSNDISTYVFDYLNTYAEGDTEYREELINQGKNMTASFVDIAKAMHTFVSTINPQIELINKINDTKFDILIDVLKSNETLKENDLEKLQGLIESMNKKLNEGEMQ